jgi:hypothetical protein
MRLKSIGLLSAAIACVTAISVSISSCDSNKGPVTPGSHGGVDQGKNPRVLNDLCKSSIGFTECGSGEASVDYDDDGNASISNLSTSGSSVTYTFDQPGNLWHSAVNVSFPTTGGSLSYEAQDAAGNTQAKVDLKASGNGYDVYPTFTSSADAGTPQYDAYILNNGTVVGQQLSIDSKDVIRINPLCTLVVKTTGWNVFQLNSQCIWKLTFDPCCLIEFQLPDGTIVNGNQIKFVERNSAGLYIYLQTSRIILSGSVATYTNVATSFAKTE